MVAISGVIGAEPCVLGTAEREQLIDEILPIHMRPIWANGERKITFVRSVPIDSATGEVLVAFQERDNGEIDVRLRRLRRPLDDQIDTIVAADPEMDCAGIVARLAIDDVAVTGPPLRKLMSLYRSIQTTSMRIDVAGDIHLDSDRVDLVVSGGMERMSLVLFAASRQGSRPHPVLTVLRDVLQTATRVVGNSAPPSGQLQKPGPLCDSK